MVKFGRNKMKVLNKLAKKQKSLTSSTSSTPNKHANKILKRKLNAEKKVSFQKEVLIKEAVSGNSSLVQNVSREEMLLKELFKKGLKKKGNDQVETEEAKVAKLKPVKKQKQRQKMQISDTKLLLNLMKKK